MSAAMNSDRQLLGTPSKQGSAVTRFAQLSEHTTTKSHLTGSTVIIVNVK